MLFKYKVVDDKGISKEGEIDAPNRDMAVSGLQRRGLIIISIADESKSKSFLFFSFLGKVSMKDIVILSRQISTLFEAQVSALKVFTMLAANAENKILSRKLTDIGDDLQAGYSISGALAKHPDVFSDFYINMVKVGEETGKLNEVFDHLANYLNRQYTLTSKTRNALIYPVFVICTFFVVMGLMFVVVIPKLSAIILDSGQEPPIYTKIVIGLSSFFVHYGFLVIIFLILLGIWLWRLSRTEKGKISLDKMRLSIPVVGNLYRKLYLSRIADNMDTMLTSGIPIVRAIDITAEVVGSRVYKEILKNVADGVKSGLSFSTAFEKHTLQVPGIMIQMIKVGEETGSLGQILKTLADFYKREVDDAIDTLVGLIEPVMIVILGLGVGILLVSVLMPIYNLAGGIQ
ncbi:MAG: Type II secretion system F domain protein [Candidatus Nomurabacteria bacterium GW2011_GWF2_35_12]|uniref:Type II secretion system F domain protein n=2 Tax=Candidatus Nomuraibacteriota TaxID=1752729 RepID=A0A0G0GFS0_9BACT|nr:MAG: Type II secretion system F domain protein [Candidatus Nomurabacteria bacterium GW2011_GWF2_35_12]KKP72559.1 MAG: Type II secretion system F domain protein [Candidatus Nomurabacteria bacterium GW2011_GWB1_35_20]KKP76588.1 MAG: Type II secretion system F domain protein [Parcubacteria group bacterium GW2011_GWC1_35_21]KKP78455.1 MAG: Type II secretion system F domain protein [Candidatus Nomurabacteria bacterium GW2011_GWC2_35_35]KKP84733.1 MAG: Type II secretion system F domain protein [Pa